MDAGFVKAESTNLPRIDALMVGEFVALNPDFCSAEQRNDNASIPKTKNQKHDLFKKVRILCSDFKPKAWVIEDKNGNPLHKKDCVVARWCEYCEELYHDITTYPEESHDRLYLSTIPKRVWNIFSSCISRHIHAKSVFEMNDKMAARRRDPPGGT
ncbi:hypothetical protein evm_006241 [Chilo suppressalis]|nr:hypothetical protein evm_006241 [Chilo suppressalis]